MTKTLLLAGAAALALSGSAYAGAAHPTMIVKGKPIHMVLTTPKVKVIYDQTGNGDSDAIDSQNFESSFAAYDDQGADDFTVPSGHVWKISSVSAPGLYYNGSGPASSVDVIVYKDAGGVPGAVVKHGARNNLSYTDSGGGSFTIDITQGGTQKPIKTGAGTYWISVVANCNFSGCGQWGWAVNTVLHGNQAMWQNPGGGFGVCPTWGTIESCIGDGPDFQFALKGKDITK